MVTRVDRPGFRIARGEVCRPAPTVGVEEEFALLDPATGLVVPRAAEVVRDCRDETSVVAEAMNFMVETRTPVCETLVEVRDSLRESRRRVSSTARRQGAAAVATGVAPFGRIDLGMVTDDARYHELARRYPFAMSENAICGCHVHVAVPTRQLGVEALLRLRAWLPALIALTGNSPIFRGRRTGWASTRFVLFSRWPTAAPAPAVSSIAEYDAQVARAVTSGEALDLRSVYFLARLSPRYPTIEMRVADVGLTADETVAYVGLVRALVATALDEAACGRPAPPVPQAALRGSCRSAARTGLGGSVPDPRTGEPVESWALVDRLVTHLLPRLHAQGDEHLVVPTLDRIRAAGGGADRQRHLLQGHRSRAAFVAALAETTTVDLGSDIGAGERRAAEAV
jgi:carboxylate-amine ligase